VEQTGRLIELELSRGAVEALDIGGSADLVPVVMLHEGLGSVSAWKSTPWVLAERSGRRVLAYSRYGYGNSAPAALPRGPDYMHLEAEAVLPELLERLGLREVALVGHSDGASIALIYAASPASSAQSVVAIAPHVFVEDCTLEGAAAAQEAFVSGRLRAGLARHHRHPDEAFWGWHDIWTSPDFRLWSIEDRLGGISCPLLLVQAADDPYGSFEQLQRIEDGVAGPVRSLVLDRGGHAPHLTRQAEVIEAIVEHLSSGSAGLSSGTTGR